MAPPPDKPYKSKLLNLINRYYIKVNSQIGVKFRELGYAIQGGLQKATLPFFWLWQSGKKIGQVFSAGANSDSQPRLTSQEIHKNLQELADISQANNLIVEVHNTLAKHNLFLALFTADFQGLASCLQNQNIVVITTNNKVDNTIDYQQQSDLKLLIEEALDNHGHSLFNLNYLTNQVDHLLSFLTNRINLNRLVNKNNSSSASVNLPVNLADNSLHNEQSKKKYQYLLPPVKKEVVQKILETSNDKLQEVLPVVKETAITLVAQGIDTIQTASKRVNKSIEDDPFQIKVLIIEAMNYFWHNQKQLQKQLNLTKDSQFLAKIMPPQTIIIDETNNAPWLSWSDLYVTPQPSSDELPPSDLAGNLPNLTEFNLDNTWENVEVELSILNFTPDDSHESESTKNLVINESRAITIDEPHHRQMTKEEAKQLTNPTKTQTKTKTTTAIDKQEYQETIETKVIEIKYEKHPLELILEKLDELIVWLEETFMHLINLVKIFISKINENGNR